MTDQLFIAMDDVSKLVHVLRKSNKEFTVSYTLTNDGNWIAESTVNEEQFKTGPHTSKKESKHRLAGIIISKFNFDEPTISERKELFRTGKYTYQVTVDNYECEVRCDTGETFNCRFSNLQTEIIKHTIKD